MSIQPVSITSTETFAVRAQRSETLRVLLWIIVAGALLILDTVRWLLHGEVMSDPHVFVPTIAVLLTAIALQSTLLVRFRSANRRGTLLSPMFWRVGQAFDLLVPLTLLTILALRSPRGPVAALSAPVLLLLPLVILLSILRLRPSLTLGLGVAAAVYHLGLVEHAIVVAAPPLAEHPVFISYGVILLLTGIAGSLVTIAVRRHVSEAADEAAAHERTALQLAAVERDLTIARDIQRGLLPAVPPDFDGFEVSGMSRPADLTGGDYFDWQQLDDGRLLVVLADVTGHGIGPALVMAVCRAYARASASLISTAPPFMRRLNELLHADLPADRFITLAMAMLDTDGHLSLLSAGHGPTFIYRAATGEVEQYGGDGLPLGVSPGESYEPAVELRMNEGDILVLLTDGFFEWQRADSDAYGIDRLGQSIVRAAHESPQRILDHLYEDVRAFVGEASQQDDVTAVVIKRCALPSAKRKVAEESLAAGV